MLKIAYTLEDRFRVLLPPDRTKRLTGQIVTEPPSETDQALVRKGTLTPPDFVPLIETVQKDSERSKLKIKLGPRLTDQGSKPSLKANSYQKRKQSVPLAPKQPPQRKTQENVEEPATQISCSMNTAADTAAEHRYPSPQISNSFPQPSMLHREPSPYRPLTPPPPKREISSVPATPMSNPDIAVLQTEPCSPEAEFVHDEGERISASPRVSTSPDFQDVSVGSQPSSVMRPRKRVKLSPEPPVLSPRHSTREPSVPPIASISVSQFRHRSPSHASTVLSSKRYGSHVAESEHRGLLMTQAIRSSESKASKGRRHWYAFGGKVQNDLFTEERDFEIPAWVHEVHPYSLLESAVDENPTTRVIHAKRKG